MKQKICSDCKHVLIRPSNPDYAYSDYLFFCKKCVMSTNFITGEKIYGTCQAKNWTGECTDFEAPDNIIKRLFGFLKP